MRSRITVIMMFCLVFMMFHCSDEEGILSVNRDLTPLEKKILGTWGWANSLENDTVTYTNRLLYEGKKNGKEYDGTFTLTPDSTLTLKENTSLFGSSSYGEYKYRLVSLTESELRLATVTSSAITYHRVH